MRRRNNEDARDWAKGQPEGVADLQDPVSMPTRPLKAPRVRTDSPAFAALFERLKETRDGR